MILKWFPKACNVTYTILINVLLILPPKEQVRFNVRGWTLQGMRLLVM